MNTVLIAIALAGTTLAEHPGLLRRQTTDREDISNECRAAASSFLSTFPTPAPSLPEFSSSYYQTASRTASNPDGDCAWVTSVPEALYTEVIDYNLEVLEWFQDDENVSLLEDMVDECPGRESATTSCREEWDALAAKIIDKTGFEPPEPGTAADKDEVVDEESDDDSESAAMLRPSPQPITIAVLLAPIIWGVVLH